MADKGIVYVSTGRGYTKEVDKSIKSVRKVMPHIPITVFTDRGEVISHSVEISDINNPTYSVGEQIDYLSDTPYEKTIYLDSDTYICDSLYECYDILDKYEMAATHNNLRLAEFPPERQGIDQKIPNSFPQYNTGVLVYSLCEATASFISDWKEKYEELEFEQNQPSFREVLFYSDIVFFTLPPEYNCRIHRPGYLHGPVKILHGRHPQLNDICTTLNNYLGPRTHNTQNYPINIEVEEGPSLKYRILRGLYEEGVRGLLRKSIEKVRE